MKTRLMIMTTLALGTASLTTGCDRGAAMMSVLANKAGELEKQLVEKLGPKARQFLESAGIPGAGAQMPTPGFDTNNAMNGLGDIGRMNQDFDQQFDAWAQKASWDLARQIPNDVSPGALAQELRQNSATIGDGQAYLRQIQDDSERRSDSVDRWTREVIRGEEVIELE